MIGKIDHIGIATKQYRILVDFYCKILGFELLYDGTFKGNLYGSIMALENPEGRVSLLDLGGFKIEIFEFVSPESPVLNVSHGANILGITHVCFSVSDIAHEYQRLTAAGMRFHCEPKIFYGEGKATYGLDPDGNIIELCECE